MLGKINSAREMLKWKGLREKAEYLRFQGEYLEARNTALEARNLAFQKFGIESWLYALSLRLLGFTEVGLGNFDDAIKHLTESLKILESEKDVSRDYADVLGDLGSIYFQIGNYDKAEKALEQAILLKKKHIPEHPSLAISYKDLAHVYLYTARYRKALTAIESSKLIYEKANLNQPKIEALYATVIQVMGEIYRSMGNYNDAEKYLSDALRRRLNIFGDTHIEVANSRNGFGMLIFEVYNDFDKAEWQILEALRISRIVSGKEDLFYATCLTNLAGLYDSQKKFEKIIPILEESAEISRNLNSHILALTAMNNLASAYAEIGKHQKAREIYQNAIQYVLHNLFDGHPLHLSLLYNLAHSEVADFHLKEALELLFQINDRIDGRINEIFQLSTDKDMMDYVRKVEDYFYLVVAITVKYFMNDTHVIEKTFNLVQRRKNQVIEALTQKYNFVENANYVGETDDLGRLKYLRQKIAYLTFSQANKDESPKVRNEIQLLFNEKTDLERKLTRNIEETNLLSRTQLADHLTLSNALPAESVLIEFLIVPIGEYEDQTTRSQSSYQFQWHYVAFILFSDETQSIKIIDFGEKDSIDLKLREYLKKVHQDATDEAYFGNQLRSILVDPIIDQINHIKRLFIAPDGDIYHLPFEVLPLNERGDERVLDQYHISYMGVGRDLQFFSRKPDFTASPPIVLANPAFNIKAELRSNPIKKILDMQDLHSQLHPFDELPGTDIEGKEIAKLLGVSPFLADKANVSTLKNLDKSPQILHIASHGFFLPNPKKRPPTVQKNFSEYSKLDISIENPMLRSGIALAGVNQFLIGNTIPQEMGSGLLTAEDILNLKLQNTELVVLSACQSGMGDVEDSEGIYGLRRAFMIAGVQTLVISLWDVPDKATKTLMIYFYEQLKKGVAVSEALRNAQLKLKTRYQGFPVAWAGFICYANPNPISI